MLDFPVLYTNGKLGTATTDPGDAGHRSAAAVRADHHHDSGRQGRSRGRGADSGDESRLLRLPRPSGHWPCLQRHAAHRAGVQRRASSTARLRRQDHQAVQLLRPEAHGDRRDAGGRHRRDRRCSRHHHRRELLRCREPAAAAADHDRRADDCDPVQREQLAVCGTRGQVCDLPQPARAAGQGAADQRLAEDAKRPARRTPSRCWGAANCSSRF